MTVANPAALVRPTNTTSIATTVARCTGTPTHTAIWLASLQAAGQTLDVPIAVDAAAAPISAFASYVLTFCLPNPNIPLTDGGAPFGAKLVQSELNLTGVFTAPSSRAAYRWHVLATPWPAGAGLPNAAGTVEAQGRVQLPAGITNLRATSIRGRVTVRGSPTRRRPGRRAAAGSRPRGQPQLHDADERARGVHGHRTPGGRVPGDDLATAASPSVRRRRAPLRRRSRRELRDRDAPGVQRGRHDPPPGQVDALGGRGRRLAPPAHYDPGVSAPVRVGTCSWADESLSKHWYPPGTKPGERLAYYAEHFDTVEVDSTFYSLPVEEMVARWAERTPEGFVMHVKAFGVMTRHPVKVERLPPDLRAEAPVDERGRVDRPPREFRAEVFKRFREALEPLRSAGKLGGILLQFPPYVVFKDRSLEYLEWAAEQLGGDELLVEFRHASWLDDENRAETLKFLERSGRRT